MAGPKRMPVASTATAPVAIIAATPVTTPIAEAVAAPAPASAEQPQPAELVDVRILVAFGDHAVNDVVALPPELVASLGDLMVDPHPDAIAAARELAA